MKDIIKRVIDMPLAVFGLVILSPIIVFVAILVRYKLGTPVIFGQYRPGLNGKLFMMYKFRSMLDRRDTNGNMLPDEMRMTKFGQLLRSTSLDELPELWNVLRGDMSLVGPRPLLEEYLPLYSPEQSRRHAVKPGITGWAQVNGRNASSWEDRLRMDVWYVDHQSLWLDMKILYLTLLTVFRAEGIRQDGHVTKEKFRGKQ